MGKVFAAMLLAVAGAAVVIACVGDETVGSVGADAGASSSSGATSSSTGGVPGGGTCDDLDTAPGGCNGTDVFCVGKTPGSCQSLGSEDPAKGCTSTTTLRCAGNSCGGGKVCCFNGDVDPTPMEACKLRLTANDTDCNPAPAEGKRPCVDATNGNLKHPMLCESLDDCKRYDAGTCIPGLMPAADRRMGVCSSTLMK